MNKWCRTGQEYNIQGQLMSWWWHHGHHGTVTGIVHLTNHISEGIDESCSHCTYCGNKAIIKLHPSLKVSCDIHAGERQRTPTSPYKHQHSNSKTPYLNFNPFETASWDVFSGLSNHLISFFDTGKTRCRMMSFVVHTYASMNGGQRLTSGVFCNCSLLLFFTWGLVLGVQFTDSARLAGHELQGSTYTVLALRVHTAMPSFSVGAGTCNEVFTLAWKHLLIKLTSWLLESILIDNSKNSLNNENNTRKGCVHSF